jgi:hypothetical protein
MTFLLQPQTMSFSWISGAYCVRNLYLRRTSLTCDSRSTVVCFLIASLRCFRKVRGFSLGLCYKAKLLFHIDTWYSGEQVSEPFWASVSLLEEWGIWSRLNYFLPLWDGWSDIDTTYLPYHFFYLAMLGIEPRALQMLGRHSPSELCPYLQIFFLFPLAILELDLRTLCLQSSTLLLEPYNQPLLVWIC